MTKIQQARSRLQQIQSFFLGSQNTEFATDQWPILPEKAAYLVLKNGRKRNALSLAVLRDLRDQLYSFNKSPVDGKARFLPAFQPHLLDNLENASKNNDSKAFNEYGWLVSTEEWLKHRRGLPTVLVLRSEGPVFSSGHDLAEMQGLSYDEMKELFAVCAEVMTLIRHSPALVVGVIHGPAVAAGAQLALTTDLPVACASVQFQLPGAIRGFPCSSPVTAMSRQAGNSFAYRMLALGEVMNADQLPGGSIEIVADRKALEKRIAEIVERLSNQAAGQPQALGKWAYRTQIGLTGQDSGGDGYEEAVKWTGRMMALHSKTTDAKEGVQAFFQKRPGKWIT